MQKFTLLAIGESFEFQGEHYLKSGPLTARHLTDNSQRMIPRSALVTPLGKTAPTAAETTPRQLPAEQVLEAFEHYHKGCREWLQMTEEVDASLAEKIREAMQAARQRFLDELSRL